MISRINRPSNVEMNEIIASHQPAIITGVMGPGRLSDVDALRSIIGNNFVRTVTQDGPSVKWDPHKGLPVVRRTFGSFLQGMVCGDFVYMQDDVNDLGLLKDFYIKPEIISSKNILREKFWMSGPGLVTPLHYDPVETFHWVIRGAKRFVVCPPGVRDYYPYGWTTDAPFISQIGFEAPAPEAFPRAKNIKSLEFMLNEGELLYLPVFWWHCVESMQEINISLNFVWFASMLRCLAHPNQFGRAARHLYRQYRATQAKKRG